jgi:hypothetical protein
VSAEFPELLLEDPGFVVLLEDTMVLAVEFQLATEFVSNTRGCDARSIRCVGDGGMLFEKLMATCPKGCMIESG